MVSDAFDLSLASLEALVLVLLLHNEAGAARQGRKPPADFPMLKLTRCSADVRLLSPSAPTVKVLSM